jgi:hypothetical protein
MTFLSRSSFCNQDRFAGTIVEDGFDVFNVSVSVGFIFEGYKHIKLGFLTDCYRSWAVKFDFGKLWFAVGGPAISQIWVFSVKKTLSSM